MDGSASPGPRLPLPAAEGAFEDPEWVAYQPHPEPRHLERSQEELNELVGVVNQAAAGDVPLRVCLHSVINTFAHPLLYVFNLDVLDESGFADLDDPELTLHIAVIANQPVELQIQATLGFLGQLLERQDHIDRMRTSDEPIDSLDAQVAAADRTGHEETADQLRYGWRSAARETARRAADRGHRLQLDYVPRYLESTEQARGRYGLLRRTYNEFDGFRELIDRMVGVIAGREPRVVGGSEQVRRWVQQRTAVAGTMQYFAQAIRDSLVLGNGYVKFTDTEPVGAYNLRPEETHPVSRHRVQELDSGQILDRAIAFAGFEQPDTMVGVGIGELMLGRLRQREVLLNAAATMMTFAERRPEAAELASRYGRMVRGLDGDIREQVERLFGWWADHAPPAPDGLYFPGQERM